MFDLNWTGWFLVGLCALLVGVSKTGLPGLGILIVPLMAMALPEHARESTGVMLGMLILGDLFAAGYYRRVAEWKHVVRMLPPAFVGIVAGWRIMESVTDSQLKHLIGIIVLAMLAVHFWRTRLQGENAPIPTQWWFAATLGFVAGVTTMMANAAGPVLVLYMLAVGLPKMEFIGTGAWFFLIVNLLKVPFSRSLDLITPGTMQFNLLLVPLVIAGVFIGRAIIQRINQRAFETVVLVLTIVAGLRLLW